jgi:hypothetical protein
MCATDHPTSNGSQSNRLTTAADFSEASLEDVCVQIANAKDDVGLPAAIQPKSLHIPTALMFEAARVLKSLGQNDTANNATNALRSMGLFQDGAKVSHYFDDDDAFFVRTDVDQGWCSTSAKRRSSTRTTTSTRRTSSTRSTSGTSRTGPTSAASTRTAAAPNSLPRLGRSSGAAHPFPNSEIPQIH